MAIQSSKPKGTKLAWLSMFIAGLSSSPPSGSRSIVLLGKALSVPQLITTLKTLVTALQSVVTTKTAYRNAVAAAKALLATNAGLLGVLRSALILAYGNDAQGLAACGIVVKPRAKRTAQQHTVSAAKGKATRKANGTGAKAPQPAITITDSSGRVMDAEGNLHVPAPANAAVASPAPAAVAK